MYRSKVPFVVCVLFLGLVTGAALAGDEVHHQSVATLSTAPSLVQWQVGAAREKVVLTISGPDGKVFTKEFASGTPSLALQELGKLAVDGVYTYELRVMPQVPEDVKVKLKDAREANDDEAASRIMKDAGLDHPLVQSGSFSVLNGTFVSAGLTEPPLTQSPVSTSTSTGPTSHPPLKVVANDIVQADDVIIQGSLCVGLDCVNNESFGFDTIRLKENNTRIKFNDTSTSAGFPNDNWQLTANDSNSGGANKFSIDDITNSKTPFTVTGNAPSNSIFVDSTGRVGFRTATPVLDLHVATGNTPALRLEQNSSGGFTAQTWDIAGNEANFFVRDVTGGSRLPFRIRPGAPTSSIDISANGNLGFGTASPNAKIDARAASATSDAFLALGTDPVAGPSFNIGYGGLSNGRSSAFLNVRADALAVAPNPSIRFLTADTLRFIIDNLGQIGLGGVTTPAFPIDHSSGAHLTAGGIWTNASSREYKQDICDLDSAEARETFFRLDPVKFTYKLDPKEQHVGFIAEDVPSLVATPDRKSLSPMDIVAVLTKVVQDQQKTIDDLSARLKALETK